MNTVDQVMDALHTSTVLTVLVAPWGSCRYCHALLCTSRDDAAAARPGGEILQLTVWISLDVESVDRVVSEPPLYVSRPFKERCNNHVANRTPFSIPTNSLNP